MADTSRNKEYQPMGGDATFCQLSKKLAFGTDCPACSAGRVATIQSLSGTGALRVGAELLKRHYPVHIVYLPDPTWGNHANIFGMSVGHKVCKYRYFNKQTKGLDYQVSADAACTLLRYCSSLIHNGLVHVGVLAVRCMQMS
eukprot:GHRR01013528.1.p1 GENE.GHRR01013528.1~~GHRR01013528.1.p1  ORF type:complete len:142 (+),score=32.43 GHRR01013528.1:506-931(+)